MKILVVEDSAILRDTIALALRGSGFVVDVSADGRDGRWRVSGGGYDCVVLDIMLPLLDGLTVLRELRAAGDATPVLLLTARDAVEDRIGGLDAGADDYVVKPFALTELVARVRALTRRGYRRAEPVIRCGSVSIDTVARVVSSPAGPIALAPREYAVLEYMARRAGEVVTRAEVEAHVYDGDAEPFSNVIDTVVYALRKKLAALEGAASIHTRRGAGYVLVV